MESDTVFRDRLKVDQSRYFTNNDLPQSVAHILDSMQGAELDRFGAIQGIFRVRENQDDPFGDAVKAAQDLPEPSTHYTPERFSDNKDFDADKAWRETMGSSW
jgi:hypothetical protein